MHACAETILDINKLPKQIAFEWYLPISVVKDV
jgi:hypothetical protein